MTPEKRALQRIFEAVEAAHRQRDHYYDAVARGFAGHTSAHANFLAGVAEGLTRAEAILKEEIGR